VAPIAAPAPAPVAPIAAQVPQRIGVVTHFFPHAEAGIVTVEVGEIRVGDTVHFRGHTTDYYQRVDRIEVDHRPVEVAHAGETVGIHVSQRVREGDIVSIVST
jgi:putative protease